MRPFSRLTVLACLMILAFDGEVINAAPPLDVRNVQQVRMVFHVIDYDKRNAQQRKQLIEMGEKAFPAYEAILSDPKSEPREISGVFIMLRDVKADRRCFLKHAVSRLTDAKFIIRLGAVNLLEHIGSPAEASPLVALLSDERTEVAYAAARALAAIGGPREVVAMDVWLRGVSHRDDADIRKDVQKYRNALKKRLEPVGKAVIYMFWRVGGP